MCASPIAKDRRRVALEIANPVTVAKVERPARAIGLTKTAFVERDIDRLTAEARTDQGAGRRAVLLTQRDLVPDRPNAFDPRVWDADRLPA